jgi:hypothetical protein
VSARTERRKSAFAKASALRKALGVAMRRKPGPLPKDVESAYGKVIAGSELTPEQHVDALMGALMTAHPEASILEICSWFDPGFLKRELGDHYDAAARHIVAMPQNAEESAGPASGERCDSDPARAIIQSSGHGAMAVAPGPARNEGGSDR